jgi:hypothetical protein
VSPLPDRKEQKDCETQLLQLKLKDAQMPTDFTFTQKFMKIILSSWVLLDSESTISVFRNSKLLRNIRKSKSKVTVHTDGGTQISKLIGDIPNFGILQYNPQSIANILSLAAVRKVCRITMDSVIEHAFLVHRKDGSIMKFIEFYSGLYYHDMSYTDRCK